MAEKKKFICKDCGYEADIYEGRGFFGQKITAMHCPDCKSIQNLVVGGIIGDVAPSFNSEAGRICPQCGGMNLRLWNGKTCPKCGGLMLYSGEHDFWQ